MPDNQYLQPFYDTLSQGVQVAEHLRQAALQQQELDQHKQAQAARQDLANREFAASQQQSFAQALQSGARPVSSDGTVAPPAPRASTSVDPATGAPTTVFDTGNQQLFTADPNRTYEVAGKSLQAPTLQDQLTRASSMENAKDDARRVPIADKLADAVGLPRGTKVTPEHMAGLGSVAHYLNPPAADNTPDLKSSHISTDDKGNQTMVHVFSDGSTKEVPLKAKGKSDKFGNPEAAAASIGARALTENGKMTAGNQAMNEFHRFESEEAALRQQMDRIDFALKTGGKYNVKIDDKGVAMLQKQKPEDDGTFDQSIVQDLQNQRKAIEARTHQAMANKKDAGQRYWKLMGIDGKWGDEAGKQAAGTPASAEPPPPAKPVPVQSPSTAKPKIAPLDKVQAYATAKKIPLMQAQAEFRQYGYTVQ